MASSSGGVGGGNLVRLWFDGSVSWLWCWICYIAGFFFFFFFFCWFFFAGFFLFLCFCIPIWGFGRWLTTVVVLEVVIWWSYDLMVLWVGYGIGYVRLLRFFFFLADFFAGFFLFLCFWIPVYGFGRWLTTVVVLVVVVWWGYDLIVQWVGCGVGFARLLVFFFFFFKDFSFTCKSGFF